MRDVRQSCNLRCPVGAIPSPADFLGLLALDKQQAAARLAAEPMDYLKLRPYQEQAVRRRNRVEKLSSPKRTISSGLNLPITLEKPVISSLPASCIITTMSPSKLVKISESAFRLVSSYSAMKP